MFLPHFFSPEPTVAYPLFQGNNYMKLSVVGSTRFSVDVIFSASRLSGLLLFNAGNEENSYVFIRMKKAVLNFCFNCGKKRVCTDLAVIQVFICLDGWRRKCGWIYQYANLDRLFWVFLFPRLITIAYICPNLICKWQLPRMGPWLSFNLIHS